MTNTKLFFLSSILSLFAFVEGLVAQSTTNDNCMNAIPLTCGTTLQGTTVGSTIEDAISDCSTFPVGDVWYQFTGTNQSITISVCNPVNVINLAIYEGTDCNDLECIYNRFNVNACGRGGTITIPSELGKSYYVAVQRVFMGTDFEISVNCAATPSNDNCENAIPITCGQTLTGTTIGSTLESNVSVPFCNIAENEADAGVWYQINGNGQNMTASLCDNTDFDVGLAVFEGSCGDFKCINFNTDFCSSQPPVAFFAEIGKTYFLLVEGERGNDGVGNFELTISCATPTINNDLCTSAIPITCGQTMQGTTLGATSDVVEHSDLSSDPSDNIGVWYRIMGNGEIITASLCNNTDFDTEIAVFGGDCHNLESNGYNDDFCNTQSLVSFPSTVGETYFIFIVGKGEIVGGDFELTISCENPPTNIDCNTATPVACGQAVQGYTSGRGTDFDPAIGDCHSVFFREGNGPRDRGVWYQIDGNGQNIILNFCNDPNYDPDIAILEGSCGTLTCVNFASEDCNSNEDEIFYYFASEIGKTYYIIVEEEVGAFEMVINCEEQQNNDNCADATLVTCGQSIQGTLINPTPSTVNDCGIRTGDLAIWYRIIGTGEDFTVDLCNSDNAFPDLNILEGSCGTLECTAFNYSLFCGSAEQPIVNFSTEIGENYYIAITVEDEGALNEFDLVISCESNIADQDGDGIHDAIDNCTLAPNPDQSDNDGDGIGDVCDDMPNGGPCDTQRGDSDGDGICDAQDNCDFISNPDQLDNDGDGIGNACDDTPNGNPCATQGGDSDGDGICDAEDNCTLTSNPDQSDNDGDGIGNVCDDTPGDGDCNDIIAVGGVGQQITISNIPMRARVEIAGPSTGFVPQIVCDGNCNRTEIVTELTPGSYNIQSQTFTPAYCYAFTTVSIIDSNPCATQGGDSDGDGICNNQDNCDFTSNPDQADNDSDGIGNLCDDTPNGGGSSNEDCNDISSVGGTGQVTISNIPERARVEIAGPSTGFVPQIVCDGNCNSTEVVPNLMEGTYNIQSQTFTPAYCYAFATVLVGNDVCATQGGDNDGDGVCDNEDNCVAIANPDQADMDGDGIGNVCDDTPNGDCNDISPIGGVGIITISNIPTEARIDITGPSTGFAPQIVCDGNCSSTEVVPNLMEGTYNIQSQTFTPAFCFASTSVLVGNDVCATQGGDSDGDGVCDNEDNCVAIANPDQADTDGDGIGNVCDDTPNGDCNDISSIGGTGIVTISNIPTRARVEIAGPSTGFVPQIVCDGNCNRTETVTELTPGTYNIQSQTFTPAYCYAFTTVSIVGSNPCATQGGDSDGDGICNAQDNCDFISNPDQSDNDGDGIGNACDDTPNGNPCLTQGGDSDGDGICDVQDNCDFISNPGQSDNDGDGIGNLCDDTPNGAGDCNDIISVGGVGQQITISNIPMRARVEIAGPSTGFVPQIVCDGNCNRTETVTELAPGNYSIQSQTFTPTYCYAFTTVSIIDGNPCATQGGDSDGDGICDAEDNCDFISNPDQSDNDGDGIGNLCDDTPNNDGGLGSDCNDITQIGGVEQITISNIPMRARVEIAGPSTGFVPQIVCDGNCNSTEIVMELTPGGYSIQSQTFTPTYCYALANVTVIGSTSLSSRSVPMLGFTAFKEDHQVSLQWETNTTHKNNYYVLEKSTDGATFEPLTQVANDQVLEEAGFHESIDESPTLGANYYRLKQVYEDGTYDYTAIKTINFQSDLEGLAVFPNPVAKTLFVNLKAYAGKQGSLHIVNQFGQLIKQIELESIPAHPLQVDLEGIQNGTYFMTIDVENFNRTIRKIAVLKH